MGKILHASGSGYFPSCIQTASNSPWTLEEAMETYWRVRTWKFEASGLTGAVEDPPPTQPFSTLINLTSGDGGTPYTTEEQLVCSNYFSYYDPINDEYSQIGFGNPGKSGSLYTSGIAGSLRDDTEGPFGGFTGYQFRVYPEYPVPTEPSYYDAVFSILGKTIPMIVFQIGEVGDVSFADVTATLTPTLWWSYGGTYNTSTGEPL